MKNLRIIAPLEIKAAADAQQVPTFSLVAYTGGKLDLRNYPHPVVIDLSGAEFHSSIIANFQHDKSRPVGTVTDAKSDGRKVVMSGVFNHAGQDREQILASNAMGFRYEASIEATPKEFDLVDDGETAVVNGQRITGPAIIATKSVIHGVAVTPQGVDDNTSVTIAASAANLRGGYAMTFEQWAESAGIKLDGLSDENKAEIQAAFQAKYAPKPAKKAKETTEPTEPTAAWSVEEIRASYDDSLNGLDELDLELANEYDPKVIKTELSKAKKAINAAKASAIAEKWSADKFGREADKAINAARLGVVRASRPTGPAIHSSTIDMGAEVIEAALGQARRLPEETLVKQYGDKAMQAAHQAFKGRMGLQQLIIMAAVEGGWRCAPGTRLSTGNLREALRYAQRSADIEASAFASVGLTGILSNNANKEILMGYEAMDAKWRRIADIKPVRDFKQNTFYRLLDNMEYEELAPDGRIKHGTVDEETYTAQAKTYAKMLAITRKDIINDDLGAFDSIRERLGRGAARKLSRVFWTAFLDNSTFFTTARGNYITGSTTNLGLDGVGLTAGVVAFMDLKSPAADGQKPVGMDMTPTKLLVPSILLHNAQTLYTASNLNGVKAADGNIHAAKYEPIGVPQLNDSSYTGYSATAWYLFGDVLNPMVVSFLDGQEAPTIESSDVDFDQLGIQFRGYHDFGVDKSEYLAGVKSKGAA